MDEISVLDYLKFKLNPKNFGKEILPAANPVEESAGDEVPAGTAPAEPFWIKRIHSGRELVRLSLNPYLFLVSLFSALAAQIVLEPNIVRRTAQTPRIGAGLYALSIFIFVPPLKESLI